MQLLLAKPVAETIQSSVQTRAEQFFSKTKRRANLAVVLVGQNPASVIYTKKKGETAVKWGLDHQSIVFPESATPNEVRAAVEALNADPKVDGILIQRPLPPSFSEEEVLYWVSPEKDVDAFHPENAGRLQLGLPCFQPCTPAGVIEILKHYEIQIAGRIACVIGRSSIVGKPMAALLLQENATIFHCHSKTPNLSSIAKQADILVVAAGKPQLVGSEYIKPGAVVVDVGIHRIAVGDAQNKVVGDVRFDEASQLASAITPVPGGVGPMTIAILLKNTVFAAERRENLLHF